MGRGLTKQRTESIVHGVHAGSLEREVWQAPTGRLGGVWLHQRRGRSGGRRSALGGGARAGVGCCCRARSRRRHVERTVSIEVLHLANCATRGGGRPRSMRQDIERRG